VFQVLANNSGVCNTNVAAFKSRSRLATPRSRDLRDRDGERNRNAGSVPAASAPRTPAPHQRLIARRLAAGERDPATNEIITVVSNSDSALLADIELMHALLQATSG
jgi:hypothetical protein